MWNTFNKMLGSARCFRVGYGSSVVMRLMMISEHSTPLLATETVTGAGFISKISGIGVFIDQTSCKNAFKV